VVGVYEGAQHILNSRTQEVWDRPLVVTITDSTAGLKVRTVRAGQLQVATNWPEPPVIENGLFRWSSREPVYGPVAFHDHYLTTQRSCDSTGKVTSFSGPLERWVDDYHVDPPDDSFTLTRTS
jgi:hypothetical protein